METEKEKLAFDKSNYMIMFVGLACMMIGFIVMTLDKEPFGFGFFGITLGPLLLCIGFVVEIFAILYKKK